MLHSFLFYTYPTYLEFIIKKKMEGDSFAFPREFSAKEKLLSTTLELKLKNKDNH